VESPAPALGFQRKLVHQRARGRFDADAFVPYGQAGGGHAAFIFLSRQTGVVERAGAAWRISRGNALIRGRTLRSDPLVLPRDPDHDLSVAAAARTDVL
jgi:hypothetical protein